MDNDSGDVAKGLAGKRGCSFQSTRPETERAKFKVDFSPNVPNPLLVERDLVPTIDRFYDISWTISAETTGIGIDLWCSVYSNGKRSSHTKDDQMNSRMVSRVLFADLVGVIQKSYVLDAESEVENEEGELDGEDGEDADAESEGKKDGKASSRGNDVAQHTVLFPGLVSHSNSERMADEVLLAPSKKAKTDDRDLENAFLKLHYSSITKGESILRFVPSAALKSAKSNFLNRLKTRINSPIAKPSIANIGVCSPCILSNKKKSCKAMPCQHCEADAKKEKYCTFLSPTEDRFLCAVYGSAGKDAAQEDHTGILTRMKIIGNEEEGYRATFDK